MKESGKIIVALLAGAAVGAAVALLLAPSSGADLREDISDYMNDLVDNVKGKASDLREYGSNALERSKSKFRNAVNDLSNYKDDLVDKAKTRAGEAVENARSHIKGASDQANDAIQNG